MGKAGHQSASGGCWGEGSPSYSQLHRSQGESLKGFQLTEGSRNIAHLISKGAVSGVRLEEGHRDSWEDALRRRQNLALQVRFNSEE